MPETKKEDKVNNIPEYGFIGAYFTDLSAEAFKDAKDERDHFFRFLDMLCLISIYQNENLPEEALDRVGTLLNDADLMMALEPHEVKPFSALGRVRYIFAVLLQKGKNALAEGKSVPLSRMFSSGELLEIEALAVIITLAASVNRKYERVFSILQEEKNGVLRPTVGLCHDLGRFFLTDEENDVSLLTDEDSFLNLVVLESSDTRRSGSEMSRQLLFKKLAFAYFHEKRDSLGDLSLCAQYRDEDDPEYICHEDVLYELQNVYGCMTEINETGIIELTGEPGSGRRFLLSLVAGTFSQRLLCVSFRALANLTPDRQKEIIADILLKAVLENNLIYIYDIPTDQGEESSIRRIFSGLQAPIRIFAIGTTKPLSDRFAEGLKGNIYRVEIPEADNKAQLRIWEEAAERAGCVYDESLSLGEIVSKYTMNPGRIFEAVKNTLMLADIAEGGFLIRQEALEEQIRRICSVSFGENAKRIKSPFVWEDLIIEPESEKLLKRVCDRIRFKNRVNDDYGFGKKLPYGRGVSVVLYGPPGTGKTMAAQVLAKELGLDIYRIDLSQISSKYIGETEKNLGAVFDAARNSNAILFFDEADSLFSKRTDVSTSNDKHANAETAYLLQKIEEYSGMSILATNNMQNFDAAFKRRMTYLIPVGIPDEETRKVLWQQSFPPQAPLGADVDFDVLAKAAEMSGSNIKSSAIAAAYMAAAEGRSITMTDIAEAADLECMKTGKMGVKNDILQMMYSG